MANGDIILFGIDVVNGASASTNSSAGTDGQGTITISGGEQVFGDNDIVVISVRRLNSDGEVTGSSGVYDLTVYGSMDDYRSGIVKYDYRPMNPGQTASIQSDLSGEGDGYLRFNANVLVPENGGPSFSNLMIAPGTDLGQITGQGGSVTLNRNQDFDFNHDGKIDAPLEKGDNLFKAGDYTSFETVCFAKGTRILTSEGYRRIEDLKIGEMVMTLDSGQQPIRWIGRRTTAARGDGAPIHFAPGPIGNDRALTISPNHRLLVRGAAVELLFCETEMLVPAKYLVDGVDITPVFGGIVTYLHIMFDQHEIIWAEGVLTESLFGDAAPEDVQGQATLAENRALLPGFQAAARRIQTARACLRRHEARVLCDSAKSDWHIA
ncbi:Hint domain-containing protein [Chachezhania antarctica]|uniref:Hint domain-containing protein n=1 Tax=Chachezhania antarctica TaxID=2340860 RepID=UPI000EB2E46C|nr:Hint domain-containing protein [Chachezhania antarctica]|tara:strand:- start:1744 stop:2880 length:1137 start_codon:yes stop_codon:yes gene_type:complete